MARPTFFALMVALVATPAAGQAPERDPSTEPETGAPDPSSAEPGTTEPDPSSEPSSSEPETGASAEPSADHGRAERTADGEPCVDLSSPELEEDEPDPVSPGEGGLVPAPDVLEQAGVGGPIPYGAQNTLEVGGAGSLYYAETGFSARIAPFAGWFILDGIELTYANDIEIIARDGENVAFSIAATLEPSVHIPLVDRLWLAIGVAGGVLYDGSEAGGIVTGRVGIDNLVGRSGMLHVSALATYASTDLAGPTATPEQETHWRVGAEIAYSVLF